MPETKLHDVAAAAGGSLYIGRIVSSCTLSTGPNYFQYIGVYNYVWKGDNNWMENQESFRGFFTVTHDWLV